MTREQTYAQALTDGLREEMQADDSVIVFGEDVAAYGGLFGVTRGLQAEFGEARVRDTPISEAAIAGFAIGAAVAGLRPVAEIQFMDFMTLAMDQLVNQAAKLHYMFGGQSSVPMVVRTQVAGRRLAAQHAQSLEAWFVHTPGLKVVMPSTPYDAKGLLKSAIRDPNPVVFIEHGQLYFTKGPVPEEEYLVPLGVSDVKRKGKDITIVAISIMVREALAAATELAEQGIEAEVIDPRTLSPLDVEPILESVRKTGRLIVTHEAVVTGGVGAEIVSRVVESALGDLKVAPRRVAGRHVPIPYNKALERAALPSREQIVAAARELCS